MEAVQLMKGVDAAHARWATGRNPARLCSVRSFGRSRADMGWRSDAPTVIAPESVPSAAQVCRGRAHPALAGAYDGRTLPCPMFLTIQFPKCL